MLVLTDPSIIKVLSETKFDGVKTYLDEFVKMEKLINDSNCLV